MLCGTPTSTERLILPVNNGLFYDQGFEACLDEVFVVSGPMQYRPSQNETCN